MNKSAVDRGLFRAKYLKKYITTIQKNQSTSQDDVFTKPDRTKVAGMGKYGSYDKLNDRGFVPEETRIENGDVILAKISPIQPIGNSSKTFKDNSESYKSHVPGVVDKVWTGIYNYEGYEMRKMRIRSERIPIIGDKYCLRKNADVQTTDGWINITKITKKHKIATLVDGKYIKYVKPIDVYNFKYNGKMYKLTSQQVDLDVTMDHELYVKKRDRDKYELIPAKDVMGKRVRFKKDCINNYPEQKYMTINHNGKEYQYDMDAFLELLGIWIADGCLADGNGVELSGEKQRKIDKMRDVCNRLNLNLTFRKNVGSHLNNEDLGCKHQFCDKIIYTFLKPYNVGALNKYLPKFVFGLSQRQSRILLNSLIHSDGSSNNQGSVCYYTSSKKLADDVMRLTIHAGWSGSIKTLRKKGSKWKIKNRTGTTNADSLVVRIVKSKNNPQINHGHCHEQNGQKEETYHYKGNVYCLEVPSHVFMIRLNGKNVWVGNCSRHRLVQKSILPNIFEAMYLGKQLESSTIDKISRYSDASPFWGNTIKLRGHP